MKHNFKCFLHKVAVKNDLMENTKIFKTLKLRKVRKATFLANLKQKKI